MTGQLYGQVQREFRSAYTSPDRLGRALQRYSRFGVKQSLRELRGSKREALGELLDTISRCRGSTVAHRSSGKGASEPVSIS